jgi:hypothetical protein
MDGHWVRIQNETWHCQLQTLELHAPINKATSYSMWAAAVGLHIFVNKFPAYFGSELTMWMKSSAPPLPVKFNLKYWFNATIDLSSQTENTSFILFRSGKPCLVKIHENVLIRWPLTSLTFNIKSEKIIYSTGMHLTGTTGGGKIIYLYNKQLLVGSLLGWLVTICC